jgi:hypothetical protein
MADEFSFDVVSRVNLQSVDDAINAANKEISVRYDFRGSSSRMEFDRNKGEITLHSDDEMKLNSVKDILGSRLVKRGVDIKSLQYQKLETALGGKVRQLVKLNQGISQEKAKAIVADIKSSKVKATPSIKGDVVRVASKSKDTLQSIISMLEGKDYGIPLQFENYR